MELMNLKGTLDYSPKEQRLRNYISDTLKETFESFGYQPLETPIICYYDLLALKYKENDEILKEVYKLTDQGERQLGLRYDLTVPFAKYIAINKGLIFPFKRYEIGKAFRDGPVKVGRNREFIQCDVDTVGISNMSIEAELISLFIMAFNKLDIDVIIKYNNRKLLIGLLGELGFTDNINDIIIIIDKLEKLSPEEIVKEFEKVNIKKDKLDEILNYFSLSFIDLKEKVKDTNNATLKEGLEEIEDLNKYLNKLNYQDKVKFTLSLARGQSYYTGTVMEVYVKDNTITSSIGGGGRYDKMITNFINDGNEYPAIGISFGLNVIYEYLSKRINMNKSLVDLYIIPMNTEVESLILANKLRAKNIKVDVEMRYRKLNKALDYANKGNIPYVIVLGDNELKTKKIILKDMFNSNNIELDIDNINRIAESIKK